VVACGRRKSEHDKLLRIDEGRKRVLLIAASILAARKLAQFDGGKKVSAMVSADAVRWAETGGTAKLLNAVAPELPESMSYSPLQDSLEDDQYTAVSGRGQRSNVTTELN